MANYLITGSNRGIGLEYCRQLKNRGDNVIATCRESSAELDKLGVRVETGIDILSDKSIEKLNRKLEDLKIDVLINNAGILGYNTFEELDFDSIFNQFKINAFAPLNFTRAMFSRLGKGSKVILMTSRMGSIKDNSSGGFYGYRMSKSALCMAGKSLSIDLLKYNISVGILHPGLVSTRMTSFTPNGITPKESVTGLLQRIDNLNLSNSGTFWHANGENLPW